MDQNPSIHIQTPGLEGSLYEWALRELFKCLMVPIFKPAASKPFYALNTRCVRREGLSPVFPTTSPWQLPYFCFKGNFAFPSPYRIQRQCDPVSRPRLPARKCETAANPISKPQSNLPDIFHSQQHPAMNKEILIQPGFTASRSQKAA